jgi:hypothetical protein
MWIILPELPTSRMVQNLANFYHCHSIPFASPQAAFHLNCDLLYKCMLIDDVATLFKILNLREALSDYMQRINGANVRYIRTLGGRCSACLALPFTHLQVWKNFCLQNKAYYYPHEILPSKVVNACPPSGDWEWGWYDPVIANLDPVGIDTKSLEVLDC